MKDVMDHHPGLSSPKPIMVTDLFWETLDHLLTLLAGLSEEEWNIPTVCAGWSVKDVALHLLGIEIGNISFRRDQHRPGKPIESWEELVAFINGWNQEWLDAARRISSPLLVELLGFTGEESCVHFCSLDPFEIGGPVDWAGPEPQPVWLDIAREYTERWHHQQHIRDAVNKPGLKEPRYLQPVLETFVRALPHTFRHVAEPEGTSITLSITGAAGGKWTLLRAKGSWAFYQGAPKDPDVQITLDEDVAWRFFTRGIDRDVARKHIMVEGDKSMAEPVFEMVSIIA